MPSGAGPAAEVEACDQEEFDILQPAIAAQAARVDELRSALSFTAAGKLRGPHEAALLRAYDAMEDLTAAGYDARYDTSPLLVRHVLAVRARPSVNGSAAWTFKQELEKRGIL